MERKITAIIGVDDDKAFEKIGDGPVPYLEKEFGRLEQSGISLKDCFIADDDEDDSWKAYLNYLVEWVFNHQGNEFKGISPTPFQKGAWIEHRHFTYEDGYNGVDYECSECHYDCFRKYRYCPDCGAKMGREVNQQ